MIRDDQSYSWNILGEDHVEYGDRFVLDNSIKSGVYVVECTTKKGNRGASYSKIVEIVNPFEIVETSDNHENMDVVLETPKYSLDGVQTEISVYPNPVADMTHINYSISNESRVVIEIINSNGQVVKTLMDHNSHDKGFFEFEFNAADLDPGLYMILLKTDVGQKSVRIVKS